MRAKKLFALLLAGSMMASVLTGCWGGKKDDSSSGTDGDSDITWTDPDYDEDEDAPVAEYTIAVDVGDYGTVKPASPIKVEAGNTATFTVTAKEGWLISGIQIDNVDQPSSGAVETLKVNLDKVSANHIVTVKYEAKTYSVTATVNNETYGSAVVGGTPVAYKGTATVTVTPAPYYVVDTVTATMEGSGSVTPSKTGDNTYTVENVTGNVTFNVAFEAAKFTGVNIVIDRSKLADEYKAGNVTDTSFVALKAVYDNGDTAPITSGAVITVTADKDNQQLVIKVSYNGSEYSDTVTGVSVVTMTAGEVTAVQNKFNELATGYTVLQSDSELVAKMKEHNSGDQIDSALLTKTVFKKADIGPSNNADNLMLQIQGFFTDNVNTLYKTQNPSVYMEFNGNDGSGTLYVAYTEFRW